MKKGIAWVLTLCLLMGGLPALAAVEKAHLQVTWCPEYEGLTRLYGTDRMLLKKNGLYGLFDLQGKAVTDVLFDAVREFDENGTATAMKGGKWGKIDRNGNTVTDLLYDTEQEAKLPVKAKILKRGGTFAVGRLDGTLLTNYRYWNAHPFSYGYAAVQDKENRWGYVDETGKEVVPCRYHSGDVGDFGPDGFAIAGSPSRYQVVDTTGRELFPHPVNQVWRAGHGLWGYATGWTIGFVDGEGIPIVKEGKYQHYTDPKGYLQGGVFDENGVAAVYPVDASEPVYIDTNGKVVENYDPTKVVSRGYGEGLQWSQNQEGKWGFVDDSQNVVVPYLYDAVGHFDHGYASVLEDGVYGMLKNPILNSDWAREEVAKATQAGYVSPRCAYYQTAPITRLQFAELAVNYLEKVTGKPVEPSKENPFIDTEEQAVLKAYAAGIVQGKGEGCFAPHDLLTRQELASMLYRTMNKAGVSFSQASVSLDGYTDGDQVAEWAGEAVAALVGNGVMQGAGGKTLRPQDTCTVEQAILLVYRAVK